MTRNRDTDVHTCHAECPCRTGGEPTPDFVAAERCLPQLWPALLAKTYYEALAKLDDEANTR